MFSTSDLTKIWNHCILRLNLHFQGVILLDPGESNDGEEDEVGNDLKLNVTWVGAEVSTGKSSLRSKNNSKKVSTIEGNITNVK